MLTNEQLEIRSKGITGSEIATVVGLNPYQTPFDLWYEKTGRAPKQVDNSHMYRGTYLEDGVKRWAEKTLDIEITDLGTLTHPDHPIVIATPDGVTNDERVVEIKCPSWMAAQAWGEAGTDRIPTQYVPQVQWELAVTNLNEALVIGYFKDDLHFYNIEFNFELFNLLLGEANSFWHNHIKADTPPEATYSKHAMDYISNQYKQRTGEIQPTNTMVDLAIEYHKVNNELKNLEKMKKELQFKVTQELGENKKVKGEGWSFTFVDGSESAKVDLEGVIQELGLAITEEIRQKHTKLVRRAASLKPYFKKGIFDV